jgi:hypothetical protein
MIVLTVGDLRLFLMLRRGPPMSRLAGAILNGGSDMSQKSPFHVAKKAFKKLETGLTRKETKAEKVARKQSESIPLEREESRKLGLSHLNKSAERMNHDRPVTVTLRRQTEGYGVLCYITVYGFPTGKTTTGRGFPGSEAGSQ